MQVAGGGQMRLRSSDPLFLSLVHAWWRQLLPRLAPLTYSRGGPIILMQVRSLHATELLLGRCFAVCNIAAMQ